MQRWLVQIISVLFFLFPAVAAAQTVPEPVPVQPYWTSGVFSDPNQYKTAHEACTAQHAHFNPNATLQDTTYSETSWLARDCHWEGTPTSNSIQPAGVLANCPDPWALVRPLNCVMGAGRLAQVQCNCEPGSQSPAGAPAPSAGNPILIAYGIKKDHELDYGDSTGRLAVHRYYYSADEDRHNNSTPTALPGFGSRWHGVIPGRIAISGDRAQFAVYMSERNVLGSFEAPYNTGTWTWEKFAQERRRLSVVGSPAVDRNVFFYNQPAIPNGGAEMRIDYSNGEYILFRRSDNILAERSRYLVPIEHGYPDGYKKNFLYADTSEYPSKITDSLGRELTLTWTAAERTTLASMNQVRNIKVLTSIGLPDATKMFYEYSLVQDDNGSIIRDRLDKATRLSSTGSTLWSRSYLYEDLRFPYALTGKLNAGGQRLSTYTYNDAGSAISTELAGGVNRYEVTRRYSTDYLNTYASVLNPLGYRTSYTFEQMYPSGAFPRLLRSVSGDAVPGIEQNSVGYNYSGFQGNNAINRFQDPRGYTTEYSTDGDLRPLSIREAVGTLEARAVDLSWHATFDLPTSRTEAGVRTDYSYSSTGLLLSETRTDTTSQTVPYSTNGQTRTWAYVWNGNGRLLSIDGPKGPDVNGRNDVDTFTYDNLGNLLTATNAVGKVTTYASYDANGRPGKITDPNGTDKVILYDAMGRVSSVNVKHPTTAASDAITLFEYDAEGRVTGLTSPQTDKVILDYDLAGRLVAVRAASGERMAYDYDAMSNVTGVTFKRINGSTARAITRIFDQLGRLVTETLGANRKMAWEYDKDGNPVRTISARSHATQVAFDALSRVVATTAPDTGVTRSTYDTLDGQKSFTDAINVTTTFVRNGFGEVIQEVSPDRGTATYYYDPAGAVIAEIDGRGQRIDYVRDALGRVTRKTPVGRPVSEIINYAYDATTGFAAPYGIGRLSSVADASGTTTFKYDHRGNVITKRQVIGSATSADLKYAYDRADRITSITYPSGRIVTYTRDSKGRITLVRTRPTSTGTDVTLASGITYEPFGSMLKATFGNGLTLLQSWGNDGRLASKRLYRTSTSANVSLWTYGYDNTDNITSITDGVDPAKSLTYEYDSVDRLTKQVLASGSARREDFIHDVNGNRLRTETRVAPTDANPSATAVYTRASQSNRLASVVDAGGTRSIGYDARGNTLSEARPGGVAVHVSYDGFGRLTQYTSTAGIALSHGYNGLDDRISTTSAPGGASDVKRFIYDGDGRLLGEYGTSPTDVKAETIWFSPEGSSDGQPFGGDDGVDGYAPLAVVTGGAVYWAHGNHLGVPLVVTDSAGATANPTSYTRVGFPGQTQTLSDLYYNRYRDYDPKLGRYVQADPIGLSGGSNLYLYAANNPVVMTDPKGLSVAGKAAGAGIGGWIGGGVAGLAGPEAVPAGVLIGRIVGGIAGSALEDCFFDDDDPCTIQKEKDDFECNQWNIKWQGTGYGRKQGYRICLSTATVREAECRSRGMNPNRITTPLFLPGRYGSIEGPTRGNRK